MCPTHNSNRSVRQSQAAQSPVVKASPNAIVKANATTTAARARKPDFSAIHDATRALYVQISNFLFILLLIV
jgi:hypothetical protein